MLLKSFWLVLLVVLIICQAKPFADEDDDDDNELDYDKLLNELRSLNVDELTDLIQLLSSEYTRETARELASNFLHHSRNTEQFSKRDALWTTTEVLDCIRRLKHYNNGSKLDLVTEMLNCYRRLKHNDHQHHTYSRMKQRHSTNRNQNRNNNQTSLNIVDVAECIDNDIDFVAGLQILLAKGSLILSNSDAEIVSDNCLSDQLFKILAKHIVDTTDIKINKRVVELALYMGVQPTSVVHNMASNCGATPEHCQGAITQGDCQTKGCPDGLCCSKFGFCGNTPEHCDKTPITNGNCKRDGCAPGQCCSVHGFCGTSPEHCGNIDLTVGQGNCQQTGCAPGLCCSRFGFCGRSPQHCLGTNGGSVGCGNCVGGINTNCEAILWRKRAAKVFRLPQAIVDANAGLASNQGFYNLLLAVGLIWALAELNGSIMLFFLAAVFTAGIFGVITASPRILFVQVIPSFLGFIFVDFGFFPTHDWSYWRHPLYQLLILIGAGLITAILSLFIKKRFLETSPSSSSKLAPEDDGTL
ncbi:hypothetical protein I4U23_020862 [Adineta vaga]|nr:hypothetical protein I4U23_020862 [Adineta vaga]